MIIFVRWTWSIAEEQNIFRSGKCGTCTMTKVKCPWQLCCKSLKVKVNTFNHSPKYLQSYFHHTTSFGLWFNNLQNDKKWSVSNNVYGRLPISESVPVFRDFQCKLYLSKWLHKKSDEKFVCPKLLFLFSSYLSILLCIHAKFVNTIPLENLLHLYRNSGKIKTGFWIN